MKQLLALILLSVTAAAAQPVFTLPKAYPLPQASVTIGWDANPPGQNVTSYNLYWGDKTRAYTNVANTTATSFLLPVVRGSTNYIAVTAMIAPSVESLFSAELVYVAPAVPSPPTNVVKVSVVVEGSTNLLQWIKLATLPALNYTNPPDPVMAFRSYLTVVNTQP